MTHLRPAAAALLILASACAPVEPEEEVIIVEPVVEEPVFNDLERGAARCLEEDITGDGIGGTGCPTID